MDMPLLNIVLLTMMIPHASPYDEGEWCDIDKWEGNRTYTTSEWCKKGCCKDDLNRRICCENDPVTTGVVYGFVIAGIMLVLTFCVYIRLRVVIANSKRRRQRQPQPPEDEAVPQHEASPPEPDLPPPYWMCVSEPPAQNGIATTPSSAAMAFENHGSTIERCPPSLDLPPPPSGGEMDTTADSVDRRVQPEGITLATASSERVQERNGAATDSNSIKPADLSQGVMLHPSALVIPPFIAETNTAETTSGGRGETADTLTTGSRGQQSGTMVVFVPGELSAEMCQSLLRSSGNMSRFVVYKNGTERSDIRADENQTSGVSNSLVSVSASPAHVRDPETGSSSTGAPPTTGGNDNSIRNSSVSEILKQMAPGTVVFFEKRGDGNVLQKD